MPKPQQPELRRSGNLDALDPDAVESTRAAHDRPEADGNVGTVPDEQKPGHRPEEDQDKPDLDAFAERLGVATEGEEPFDAPNVTEAEGVGRPRWKSQWRRLLIPTAIAVGLVVVVVQRRLRS